SFEQLVAAPVDELNGHPFVRGPLGPLRNVLVPPLLRRLSSVYSSIGAVEWNADEVPHQLRVLLDGCLDGLIELAPLRVAKHIDVLGLPSPLGVIAQNCVTLDSRIRSALPNEPRTGRAFGVRQLRTQLLEALIAAAIQGPDIAPVKSHSPHASAV